MVVVDPNDDQGLDAAGREVVYVWRFVESMNDPEELRGATTRILAAFFKAADTKPTTHEVDRGMLLGVRAAERWVTDWEEVADG